MLDNNINDIVRKETVRTIFDGFLIIFKIKAVIVAIRKKVETPLLTEINDNVGTNTNIAKRYLGFLYKIVNITHKTEKIILISTAYCLSNFVPSIVDIRR